MYDFIEGRLVELDPISATVQTGGFGYSVNISLNTFTALQPFLGVEKLCKLYLHHVVREDAQLFYGFFEKRERSLFRLLISVSGVGAGTARMILSALSAEDLQKAIAESNVNTLKNVKGIGLKTAQRIIVDLKDKIGAAASADNPQLLQGNASKNEALSALVNLGFAKTLVEKVIDRIAAAKPSASVEEMIKEALKSI
ncbi:MAG: Holliday junction branch migration protein RuvA [Bacteroidales bacterium]|jgi:Holliday junction DNA helicase RuvA|nr:Holliday junction branch migration protein RuvA [Bacteroidales bacterium]